jgi:hypothetical protein
MHTPPDPNLTTAGVLDALQASGKPLQEWGRAIDGTPLLAARTGGDKQPAIFITAGAHSGETAGVHAALSLLHALDTEHEVHILPLRDPLGFDGINHCFSFATGGTAAVPSHRAALDYLLTHSQLIRHEGNMHIFTLGDLGFVWEVPSSGIESFLIIHARMLALVRDEPQVLQPLRGKRVMLLCAMTDVEGTGETLRCWHGVMSQAGEWLHLNRFFGRDDAPPEVAAVDRLMQTVRPGLTCDLHEGPGEGFWMPIPVPEENQERVFDMTKAFFDYIHSRGYPITTFEQYTAIQEKYSRGYRRDWIKPEPRLPGLIWHHGLLRGEGYNLLDYGGLFGIGYGTEAPVARPLAMRVDGLTHGIIAAIKVWEQTV